MTRPGPPGDIDPPTGTVATRIALNSPVRLELADEIRRRMLFISAEIVDFELVTEGAQIVAVTVHSAGALDPVATTRKVNTAVDNDVRPQVSTPTKAVWRSPVRREVKEGTFEALAAIGAVAEVGEGQIALGEPLLTLFRYFDQVLLDLLTSSFAVRQFQYPTLIRTDTLAQAGYLEASPQNLFFVTRLHNDSDVYRGVRDTLADGHVDSRLLESCRNVDYCLPPTMCYHVFSQYRDSTVGDGGVHVVTTRGKAFRFEAGYATTLERLWDFTIREMVFMGTRAEILDARMLIMSKTFDLVRELGMSGHCEVGNDPFFGGADTADRVSTQRMMELKYELRMPVGIDRTVAVGSFNFHNTLFGRDFAIEHCDGGAVWSACVGFGLERLVYAFVCQFGPDERLWPSAVRSALT